MLKRISIGHAAPRAEQYWSVVATQERGNGSTEYWSTGVVERRPTGALVFFVLVLVVVLALGFM
jgi:hypothetical protein